jgi:FKBP-type peptidyl-prolyl cis-trans isomerase 2
LLLSSTFDDGVRRTVKELWNIFDKQQAGAYDATSSLGSSLGRGCRKVMEYLRFLCIVDPEGRGRYRLGSMSVITRGGFMKRTAVAIMMVAGLVLSGTFVKAQDGVVGKGKRVKLDYTLTVDGKVVESTEGKQPLEYDQGAGMLIIGLEKELEGMKTGETKKVVVKPEDAYGQPNAELVKEFDKAKMPEGMKPEKGLILEMTDPQGNAYPCTITDIKDKTIVLDFNHPLAGKTLTFDVKVGGITDTPPQPVVPAAVATTPAAPAIAAPEVKK